MKYKITDGLKIFRLLLIPLFSLSGCAFNSLYDNPAVSEAHVTDKTRATEILMNLPEPERPIPVVVYEFLDQTGQFKNNGMYTDYSSAVTRGGYSILVKALLDSGEGKWFMLAERGALKNLLQERQIIKLARVEYNALNTDRKLPDLPPMLYGGTLIEGGIISYDSNVMSGGIGATYLGIGGATQYRRDLVTVYLRAVSIETGRVLLSVQSSKTIYSVSLDGTFMRYLTVGNLFQSEAGFAINEPVQFGVRQAIETAVYSLLMEGAMKHLWEFKDDVAGNQAIATYIERRDHSGYKQENKELVSGSKNNQ
ncbi:MAG: curli production assembly protein CsgG [Chlorobaculum sp.]|nr:curli production assembly protein CsgG [Chlorobaculum sp.]